MVKEIARTIEIPEGVSVSLSRDVFTARGPKGTVERMFWYPGIKIEVGEDEVVVDAESSRKEQKAMVGTFASHIKNLITGVTDGFECKMSIVYAHFPMQVKVDGKTLVIGNFLGEKEAQNCKNPRRDQGKGKRKRSNYFRNQQGRCRTDCRKH